MRALAVAALPVLLVLTIGRSAWAAGGKEVDYTGWRMISTGTEITRATYHSQLGYTLDDKCTVVKRGTATYVVKKNPWGKGLESFSMDLVSASTTIMVSGGGQASAPVNERWSYKLGPSPYPKNVDSFSPSHGGAPQTSPDEPMFMPRTIEVSSYVPESHWRPDPLTSLAEAQGEAVRAWQAAGEGEQPALEFVFPHRLDAQHLTASGHRTFSHKPDSGIPEVSASCEIEVSYNVVVIPTSGDKPPPRVELEETDRSWWPEDGDSLTATAKVTGDKPAQAFRFTLYDVSKEPGKCGNSDDAKTDPDLSFAPDQGDWSIKQDGEQWVATSDNEGRSASIGIACHDWGAWGKLKAEAKIEDEWEPAQVAGSGLGYVRIPYDDDDDHIADSWQAAYGVGGKAAKDDSGKKPTDQANDGDGLSVYECYRGFEVLGQDGMSSQTRLDPLEKTLFVLDLSGYFGEGLWKQCSGITAYLVGQRGCRIKTWADAARLVNFRSANAKNGDKYCVVVTAIGAYKPGDTAVGLTKGQSGAIRSPRDVDGCYVYPGVADAWLQDLAQRLQNAYDHPDSADGRDFGDPKPGPDGTPTNPAAGLPRRMWQEAANRLKDPAVRQQLVAQCLRWTAIHEMGHACGLMGHVAKGDPDAKEIPSGNKSCPMRYSDNAQDLQYAVLQVLLKPDAAMPMAYGQFCRDADFNCWGHLNVKDN
jgi:hypothetical protein